MNKKLLKKILIIVILFMILFVAYRLINTYAVFYSEGQGKVVQKNATWTIYVNERNISSKNSNQFNVDTFEIQENEHVAEGKLAPNTTGSFYLIIDPKNTNVSIRYDIELDQSKITTDRVKITSIEEVETQNSLTRTAENTYTGIIPLDSINAGTTNKVKVTINWENDETNNEKDTLIGTNPNAKMSVPINVTVTQYLGETIEEYTPVVEE
ncbi:MAG: hypothetical protein ACI4VQ_05630 [Clostridia bacterium]